MSSQSFTEKIAARQVSLALVLGGLILVGLVGLTLIMQFWLKWIDLTQNLTDLWIWALYIGIPVGFTFINVGLWRGRRQKTIPLMEQQQPNGSAESAYRQLMLIATLCYSRMLREALLEVGKQFDDGKTLRFTWWDKIEPDLKKKLITYKPEYDALEDFSKSLIERNNNVGKADFDAWNTLCKNHYEHLKRTGFV